MRNPSTPYFDNLRITPIGRTQATKTVIPTMLPLYR